jgi:hypothetical protein
MEDMVESARAIAQFFLEQGFTEECVNRLGLAELPLNSLARRSATALVATGNPRLDLLIRLFCLGEPIEKGEGQELIPKPILRGLLASGLLAHDAEQIQPVCMLTHFGELILACDSCRRAEAGPSDLVLGVNSTTRLLARCSMLCPGAKALDLGTGCGTLALAGASCAEFVIGSDINHRALNFGRINAALNGVSNVSFLQGDRFEPVAGRRFDFIICNPPFFLAPVSGLLYCDNGMELDGFVESLARRAPQYLEEGGVFQMLCEWVEFGSESWEQRLRPWFEQSHCDVHIWRGYDFSPAEYARKRALEQGQIYPASVESSVRKRIAYLTERGVQRIFGGLISMRRYERQNWFWVEEMQKRPAGPIGHALRDRFSTRDVLESSNEQTLLAARPKLAGNVHLVTEAAQRNGVWSVERTYLERSDDLPGKMGLDGIVAQLAARFDATETLETLFKKLASEQNAPVDMVIPEGLRVVRSLATSGLILLEPTPKA